MEPWHEKDAHMRRVERIKEVFNFNDMRITVDNFF